MTTERCGETHTFQGELPGTKAVATGMRGTVYKHGLVISLPIVLFTKANVFAQSVTPCLKMVFLLLVGMADPQS